MTSSMDLFDVGPITTYQQGLYFKFFPVNNHGMFFLYPWIRPRPLTVLPTKGHYHNRRALTLRTNSQDHVLLVPACHQAMPLAIIPLFQYLQLLTRRIVAWGYKGLAWSYATPGLRVKVADLPA